MANLQFRVLWWSLVVSQVVYVVMAHVVRVADDPPPDLSVLTTALVAISGAVAIGTLVLRRRALVGPIQEGRLDPSTHQGLQAANTPFTLNLVLSESIGIYGLVLSLLSGDPSYSLAFSGASIALLFVHRPTAPDLVPPMSGLRP